ncbi:MAG: Xaa-Pro aminopeptidase, partial [uncultured Gemmatimonadetes bacterium]
ERPGCRCPARHHRRHVSPPPRAVPGRHRRRGGGAPRRPRAAEVARHRDPLSPGERLPLPDRLSGARSRGGPHPARSRAPADAVRSPARSRARGVEWRPRRRGGRARALRRRRGLPHRADGRAPGQAAGARRRRVVLAHGRGWRPGTACPAAGRRLPRHAGARRQGPGGRSRPGIGAGRHAPGEGARRDRAATHGGGAGRARAPGRDAGGAPRRGRVGAAGATGSHVPDRRCGVWDGLSRHRRLGRERDDAALSRQLAPHRGRRPGAGGFGRGGGDVLLRHHPHLSRVRPLFRPAAAGVRHRPRLA